MKVNRKGVTRIVLEFNTFVIKIPNFLYWDHFLRGLLANIDERDTWKTSTLRIEGDLSYLLCPVLWTSWGGWILCMRKADVNKHIEEDRFLNYSAWVNNGYGGDKAENFGYLEGRLVKVDYGQLG